MRDRGRVRERRCSHIQTPTCNILSELMHVHVKCTCELNTTATYEHEDRDSEHVVNEHITFMANNNICIGTELRQLPSFYWLLLSYAKIRTAQDSLQLQRNVVLNACLNYLLFASRKSQTISNNIVEVYTYEQESIAFEL